MYGLGFSLEENLCHLFFSIMFLIFDNLFVPFLFHVFVLCWVVEVWEGGCFVLLSNVS
jgi:hypothetical protein